ncbi:MAG: hypothetical protein KQJ78_14200 [Deltaproteobacteria bacterium]|nr:hypothetical protein [Deltaproteobacteria bacterium]
MHDPLWLVRELSWFPRESDQLAGKCEIKGVSTRDMQRAWGRPPDDPMLASFPVGRPQAAWLARHVPVEIRLDRFDYFVETCTKDWDQTQKDQGFLGQYPPPCDFLESE